MAQANVVVNGRSYPLQCAEGDEARLQALADHVRGKVDALVAEFGQVGDERLLLLAALLTADELFDLRERHQADVATPDATVTTGSAASGSAASGASAARGPQGVAAGGAGGQRPGQQPTQAPAQSSGPAQVGSTQASAARGQPSSHPAQMPRPANAPGGAPVQTQTHTQTHTQTGRPATGAQAHATASNAAPGGRGPSPAGVAPGGAARPAGPVSARLRGRRRARPRRRLLAAPVKAGTDPEWAALSAGSNRSFTTSTTKRALPPFFLRGAGPCFACCGVRQEQYDLQGL